MPNKKALKLLSQFPINPQLPMSLSLEQLLAAHLLQVIPTVAGGTESL